MVRSQRAGVSNHEGQNTYPYFKADFMLRDGLRPPQDEARFKNAGKAKQPYPITFTAVSSRSSAASSVSRFLAKQKRTIERT